jgi:alcohol dehydrogenase (NADP+)
MGNVFGGAARPVTRMASVIGGPTITLNDGRTMPQVGLGTWKSKPGEVKAAVKAAVKCGYRHIDCAAVYKNEHEVGEALTELFEEGVVTREELWITSKLWNDFHRAESVPEACATTLGELNLEYLDLYLIHWPVATGCAGAELTPPIRETWAAMEALRAAGTARSIGVSNFSAKKLAAMKAHATVFPAVNQVELHPYLQQTELQEYCAREGIVLQAYASLGGQDAGKGVLQKVGGPLLEHAATSAAAAKHGVTPAQVLLRWGLQKGFAVIPKTKVGCHAKINI